MLQTMHANMHATNNAHASASRNSIRCFLRELVSFVCLGMLVSFISPMELVSFVSRRELVSFDQRHVTRSPPIGKRI